MREGTGPPSLFSRKQQLLFCYRYIQMRGTNRTHEVQMQGQAVVLILSLILHKKINHVNPMIFLDLQVKFFRHFNSQDVVSIQQTKQQSLTELSFCSPPWRPIAGGRECDLLSIFSSPVPPLLSHCANCSPWTKAQGSKVRQGEEDSCYLTGTFWSTKYQSYLLFTDGLSSQAPCGPAGAPIFYIPCAAKQLEYMLHRPLGSWLCLQLLSAEISFVSTSSVLLDRIY